MTQSSHISIKTVIILLFADIFFFGGKLFRFSTKRKQKCISASVFDFFCRTSRQTLSNSFTSSDANVLRFPFLSCFGVIVLSSWLWAVNWKSSSLDCEITGWHEGNICCGRLKVREPGGMVTLISFSGIAGLVVVTWLVKMSLSKFSSL